MISIPQRSKESAFLEWQQSMSSRDGAMCKNKNNSNGKNRSGFLASLRNGKRGRGMEQTSRMKNTV
jgi:hypothetical protein